MFLVRFVRDDERPDEFYAYWNEKDAKTHFEMFLHDGSHLYKRIELIQSDGAIESVLSTTLPSNT